MKGLSRIRRLMVRDGGKCQICGVEVEPGCSTPSKKRCRTLATIDHIIPRSRGGSDEMANLQLACYPCNQAKGDRMPSDDDPGPYRMYVPDENPESSSAWVGLKPAYEGHVQAGVPRKEPE